MRGFSDPVVTCPYDKSHKMPAKRLQWHFAKCKAKQERAQLGLPDYHCRFNFYHLFFTKEELDEHEADCERESEDRKATRLENQNKINQALLDDHGPEAEDADSAAGAEDQDETTTKPSELFKAYRAGQTE